MVLSRLDYYCVLLDDVWIRGALSIAGALNQERQAEVERSWTGLQRHM